jgi:hypothetical protein
LSRKATSNPDTSQRNQSQREESDRRHGTLTESDSQRVLQQARYNSEWLLGGDPSKNQIMAGATNDRGNVHHGTPGLAIREQKPALAKEECSNLNEMIRAHLQNKPQVGLRPGPQSNHPLEVYRD